MSLPGGARSGFGLRSVGFAARDQDDVRRLDVAMDDPDAVCVRERVGDLRRDLDRAPERQRRALLALRDVLALEPLHRDVWVALVELAERDDAHDPRVAEAGEHAALAPEAGLLPGVDARNRDDLERDRRARHLVARAIHDTDSTASHLAFDHEAACEEPLKGRGRHEGETTQTSCRTHLSCAGSSSFEA